MDKRCVFVEYIFKSRKYFHKDIKALIHMKEKHALKSQTETRNAAGKPTDKYCLPFWAYLLLSSLSCSGVPFLFIYIIPICFDFNQVSSIYWK